MNSKHKNFKRILSLEGRQGEISITKGKLGYEKLETPYLKGWDGYWVLRDDIARSENGERLSGLIEYFGRTIFSPNKEFQTWSKSDRKYHDHKPYFGKVDEETYDRYYSWVQEWFVHDPTEDRQWWNGNVKRYYRFTIPEWMLVMEKEKHWVTHYKVMDEVLEQEDAELSDKITELKGYVPWYRSHGTAKPYQRQRNRTFRSKEKREVKKAMRSGNFDDMNLPIQVKQVLYDLW